MRNNLSLQAHQQITHCSTTTESALIHLDMQQSTVFEESKAQEAVDAGPKHTELLTYFYLNH
jgi:hypothetical protein